MSIEWHKSKKKGEVEIRIFKIINWIFTVRQKRNTEMDEKPEIDNKVEEMKKGR
jgi:hypothetical protein